LSDIDLNSCAEIVLKADPDRFAAVMAAPVALRTVLFPMHAMAIEVARAPWMTQESMIAEMRLQWWRDALEEIASGGKVRRHEVVTPLSKALPPEAAKLLDGFVEVRRWDIYKEPFEDADHLRDYLTQTGGTFYRAIALAFGEDGDAAADFGFAVAVSNWLMAVAELESRGRVPLLDGRPEGVKALAQDGLKALHKARGQGISRRLGRAFLSGWQAEKLLLQAVEMPTRVAEGSLGLSEFSKKHSLLWASTTGRI